MERLRRKSGGDKKKSRDGTENEEVPVRRRYSTSDGGGGRSPGGEGRRHSSAFCGGSEGDYDLWRMSTTNEDTPIDEETLKYDVDDAGMDGDGGSRFPASDRHQTTFSENSLDRRWTFNAEDNVQKPEASTVGRSWSVSFDGGQPQTNIDDLIQDMDEEERWSFGHGQRMSTDSAWTVSDSVLTTTVHNGYSTEHDHAWDLHNLRDGTRSNQSPSCQEPVPKPRTLKRLEYSARVDQTVCENANDADDTESVDTASTDTDSVFRREESDSMNERRRKFLKEMALRGQGLAISRLTEGYVSKKQIRSETSTSFSQHPSIPTSDDYDDGLSEHQRTGSWDHQNSPHTDSISITNNINPNKTNSLPFTNKQNHHPINTQHHKPNPTPLHQTSNHITSPANSSPKKLVKSPRYTAYSLDHASSPKTSPTKRRGLQEVWRAGGEDGKTEQQRRLDAWVSSIQTHWGSTGSCGDFPCSFEDNFLGLEDDGGIFCDFPDLEYEDHSVLLSMGENDTRFGFSVIGGFDEGIAPRVDDITSGSPAERAGLEVGDEIVEVNGKPVDRCAHADIIAHIHQCIQSKSIRLRVKRLKEGEKVPAVSKVHDAYIIAVEENARRKLEDASASHRVVPVDLTRSPPPPPPPPPPPHTEEEAVTVFRGDSVKSVPQVNGQVERNTPQVNQTSPVKKSTTPVDQSSPVRKGQPHVNQTSPVKKSQPPVYQSSPIKKNQSQVNHSSPVSKIPSQLNQIHSTLPQANQLSHTSQSLTNSELTQQGNLLPVSAPKSKSVSPTKPPRQLNVQQKLSQQKLFQQQREQPLKQQQQNTEQSFKQQAEQPSKPQKQQEVEQPLKQQHQPKAEHPLKVLQQQQQANKQLSIQHQLHQQDSNLKPTKPLVPQKPIHASPMPVQESQPSPSKHGGLNGSVEALETNGMMMMMEREQESPRKGKGSKGKKGQRGSQAISHSDTQLIEEMLHMGGLAPNGNASDHNSLTRSRDSVDMPDSEPEADFQHSPESSLPDSGPHREMAIDCPDSFLATVKTPPKYPPPYLTPVTTTPRVPPTTPSKNTDSLKDKERTEATLSDAALMVAERSEPKPTADQLERLHKHQEELRKRREEENRHQIEQDFLRTSLRGSKKLQALENRRMAQAEQPVSSFGIINTAFEDADDDDDDDDDEGEIVDNVDGLTPAIAARLVSMERYLKKNAGVEDVLSTLQHIRTRLNSADNTNSSTGQQEVQFLKQLFHNPLFQQTVDMHQKMVDVTSRSPLPRPLGSDCQELACDVKGYGSEIGGSASDPMVEELSMLLDKPALKNLLKAHDEVADQQTRPIVHVSESDLIDYPLTEYGEESVKIIHLEKTNEHLGATVKNEGDSVLIARIVKGGAAEKSGLLHEGDEILEVNGIDMRAKNVNEVSEILGNMSGTITFMIIPALSCVEDTTAKPGEIMHLRALFNYDPEDDPYIPCRELGISFLKGDILHAIQLSDSNWWQAHREGEDAHMLAGLIPSKAFQEQRESVRQQLNAENKENKKRGRICACGRKERKKRKKKALYNGGVGEDTEEILTYEEVTRYYPQPNRKRPIVLVGPPDIGRQELRERIMESDFDRFAAAVPHTSRTPMAGEHNGKDYHFITRAVFEADMLSGKFVEYGEFQGNLYGTTIEAVKQVIQQGRICILNLGPESLKNLRETELKPYIIFISPPNMEKLRQLQMALGKPRPTDDQVKEVIERGREMEEMYSHYFDYILVNMELNRAYDELLQEINRIETEPQWVPITWVNNYT